MRIKYGDVMPEFHYDTPYQPQKSFQELTLGNTPLAVIFLANFGHPITRYYLAKYYQTYQEMIGCRLAVVVKSKPQVISAAFPPGAIPFEIICDPEGTLYDYFEIPTETNAYKYATLESLKILRAARKEGYKLKKDQPQQLPLTLILAPGGGVGMAHYGVTLTDFPEDCLAIQRTVEHMEPDWMEEWDQMAALGFVAPEEGQNWMELDEPAEEEYLPEEEPAAVPAGDPLQGGWQDNTAELLLDFTTLSQPEQEVAIPRDDLYNTTGEIDILGSVARQLGRNDML